MISVLAVPDVLKLLVRKWLAAHALLHRARPHRAPRSRLRRPKSSAGRIQRGPTLSRQLLLSGVQELDAVTLILEGVERLPAVLFAFVLDGRRCPEGDDHQIPRGGQAR